MAGFGNSSQLGSTISLYLAEGKPAGVRVVQKDNWSGIGIDCSRTDFAQARKNEAFGRSGVYLLVGTQPEAGGLSALYVGEADELGPRLANHATNKDFWTRLVIFTSQDGSINRAHAKHLESRLYEIGAQAKKSRLENKVPPGQPKLSNQDRDFAERFLAEMLVVLPVIGITAFELPEPESSPSASNLELKGKSTAARGRETSQGFKVLQGSLARAEEVPKIQPWIHELRADLVENGVLVPGDGVLVLSQDYVFSSPSAAAAVMLGRSANGRELWRRKDGKTLKQIQEEMLAE
jgi:uncharacterized protein DUF4357